MKDSVFHNADLSSPAYVYDQSSIMAVLHQLELLKKETGCLPLYSIKSANMTGLLELIKPYVSGFSCSSLFEVKLSKEILSGDQSIHITTPGYRDDEWQELISVSNCITLNSISQWQRYAKQIADGASCGIRINPELSFVNDERYDPCRPGSKLGITRKQLLDAADTVDWSLIEGLHIHNNCESNRFDELKQSVETLFPIIDNYKSDLKWINLGGGYLFKQDVDLTPLTEIISVLKNIYDVNVFIEPGKAITGHAGYLVSTIIDLIDDQDVSIAVLDASINHIPEVFEFQYQPKVMFSTDKGEHQYRLFGCSCLSGDLFGDYYFNELLKPGDKIIFEDIGAYMQVKANMFNGINLPATYLLDSNKELKLLKQHDYQSFRQRL